METLGDFLKRKREENGISIEEISKKTKIQPYIIKALENNDFSSLPHQTFIKGFIKIICNQLDADYKIAMELFEKNYETQQISDECENIFIFKNNNKWKFLKNIDKKRKASIIGFIIVVLLCISVLFFAIRVIKHDRETQRVIKNSPKIYYSLPEEKKFNLSFEKVETFNN